MVRGARRKKLTEKKDSRPKEIEEDTEVTEICDGCMRKKIDKRQEKPEVRETQVEITDSSEAGISSEPLIMDGNEATEMPRRSTRQSNSLRAINSTVDEMPGLINRNTISPNNRQEKTGGSNENPFWTEVNHETSRTNICRVQSSNSAKNTPTNAPNASYDGPRDGQLNNSTNFPSNPMDLSNRFDCDRIQHTSRRNGRVSSSRTSPENYRQAYRIPEINSTAFQQSPFSETNRYRNVDRIQQNNEAPPRERLGRHFSNYFGIPVSSTNSRSANHRFNEHSIGTSNSSLGISENRPSNNMCIVPYSDQSRSLNAHDTNITRPNIGYIHERPVYPNAANALYGPFFSASAGYPQIGTFGNHSPYATPTQGSPQTFLGNESGESYMPVIPTITNPSVGHISLNRFPTLRSARPGNLATDNPFRNAQDAILYRRPSYMPRSGHYVVLDIPPWYEDGIISPIVEPSNSTTFSIAETAKKVREQIFSTVDLECVYNKKQCFVCLNDFEADSIVVLLPCRHIFHSFCAKKWLNKKSTCPVCRKII